MIEISSNGRKKYVDKWIPICWLLLIKSGSRIWFEGLMNYLITLKNN